MKENASLGIGISAAILTAVTSLIVAVVTAIVARKGAKDAKETADNGYFSTRLTGVEKELRDTVELLEKERRENAAAIYQLNNAALIDAQKIKQLELAVEQNATHITEHLNDFLQCQENVNILKKALEENGIKVTLIKAINPGTQSLPQTQIQRRGNRRRNKPAENEDKAE